MQQQCAINKQFYDATEGFLWKQLRPSLQKFLSTLRSDWNDESFISYVALSDLLQQYVVDINSRESSVRQQLQQNIRHRYEHDETLQPIVPPPNSVDRLSYGQRLADRIASFGGSWPFIIIFLSFLVVWMGINILVFKDKGFDPYPFILLNLLLSCLAALQAPVIMMSQNRQEDKDRARAEYDFLVNRKAETEIRLLHKKLDHIMQYQHQNIIETMQLQLDFIALLHEQQQSK